MKENKGITLVALVITIIVLLILAGVTISIVLNGGILNKAQTAIEQYSQEQVREKVQQILAEYATEKYTKSITLDEFLNTKKNNGKIEEFIKNDDGTYTITLDGYDVIINDSLEIINIEASKKGSVSMTYVINKEKGLQKGKISVLVTFKNDSGIKTIQTPEGEEITGNEKIQIGIDYLVEINKEYKFIITKVNGTEVEKILIVKLTDDFITVGEPIIGIEMTSTESVADRSQAIGTELYINFEATMFIGEVAVVPSLPYKILDNGEYAFTVIGKYEEEEIRKNVIVKVNKYEPPKGEAPTIIPSTTDESKSVTIEIIYKDSLIQKQYKLEYEDGTQTEWTDYTQSIEIDKNNTTIFARGLDEAEVYTEEASYKITNIVLSPLPTPTITMDKEPYIIDGVKWYPYGTNVIIKYSEDMEGLTAYYYIGNNTYSVGANKEYTIALESTSKVEAKIYATELKVWSEGVSEEIHIMANPSGKLQKEYQVVGNKYPVLVTGTTESLYNIYGTDIYYMNNHYTNSINKAAAHAGLVKEGETKLLMIKIVECPKEGFIGSTKNGITSVSIRYNSSFKGIIFTNESGEQIKSPTIDSISQTPAENEVTVTVQATAYAGATIEKYYYQIDSEIYIESSEPRYTFTQVQPYVNHTIRVYVKDSNGTISFTQEITSKTTKAIPTPTITMDKEPYIIDGVEWYPYGTKITIMFAENMTNLTGYYRLTGYSNWNKCTEATYNANHEITTTIKAKVTDEKGEESEIVEEEIHIMANPGGNPQKEYKVVGNRSPVLVTGDNYGYVGGTDIYWGLDDTRYTINKAAIHAGLVKEGETKLLMIEIVESPKEGFIGSTRNGITSFSISYNSSHKGFVFIDENGEQIKTQQ